jgi:hypothetical protein
MFNLRRHLYVRHQIDVGYSSNRSHTKKSSPIVSTLTQERRDQIDYSILQCIVRGGLPYNHFAHPWFHSLFDSMLPGYRAPDRRTITRRVHILYRDYIKDIKSVLPKDAPLAYTTDLWKSPTRNHYICLTVHVFNKSLHPVSLLLSFRRMTGRKLSKNINDYIAYELERFGLTHCSHAGITTDNASDMKAATSHGNFGLRFPCIAHTLNLIVHHRLCLWETPNEKR